MQQFPQKGFTEEEILDVILARNGTPRVIDFRFALVDKFTKIEIADLTRIESASIDFSAESEIKRTAKITTNQDFYEVQRYALWSDIGGLTWQSLA